MYISSTAQSTLNFLLDLHREADNPAACARADLNALLDFCDVEHKDTKLLARLYSNLANKWAPAMHGTNDLSRQLHRAFITDSLHGTADVSTTALVKATRTHRRKIQQCRFDAIVRRDTPVAIRLIQQRQSRSDRMPPLVIIAIEEWFKSHCKSSKSDEKLVCLMSYRLLHSMYSRHHDKLGTFFLNGSPEWLQFKHEGEVLPFSPPLSYPTFSNLQIRPRRHPKIILADLLLSDLFGGGRHDRRVGAHHACLA